ncbi:DUF4384 domain-containing protein [Deinococcus aquiradiocola]|uniref:S-layer protein n=1 Tax=Deinococcus aquiradiocola TaxID=393059 RepID=A0A917PL03_9DEIO|nr:DUF4384 domain-containing protein [Deinococcus aquiradiocola]GGJ82830.1 S-layer protein [Deinococcus aquiradiocola]
MNKTKLTALLAPLALGAVLLGTAVSTNASAAPKLSAQSIIVNPVQTSLSVKVWTDRDTSGAQTPNYSVGDKIRIYTSVNQDAYVYLFNVDPNGQVDLILPNRYAGGANYVRAGTVKAFPSSQDRFTFDIAAPYGLNKVLALASKTQLNLNDIATFQTQNSSQGFADVKVQGQQQLAQALSIVVNPVPQNTWISDTAYYNVAQGYSAQPAPAPVVSVPSYGFPVYTPQGDEWRSTFSTDRNADDVYAYYAAQLQRQGFRQVDRRADRGRYAGEFQNGNSTSELRITLNGGKVEVVIIKRN